MNIQDFLIKAFNNQNWHENYSIHDEVEYIKKLTDDENEIITFFENMYTGTNNIRFNRKTMDLEYFDYESETDDDLDEKDKNNSVLD